jgi:hypothetical protein
LQREIVWALSRFEAVVDSHPVCRLGRGGKVRIAGSNTPLQRTNDSTRKVYRDDSHGFLIEVLCNGREAVATTMAYPNRAGALAEVHFVARKRGEGLEEENLMSKRTSISSVLWR